MSSLNEMNRGKPQSVRPYRVPSGRRNRALQLEALERRYALSTITGLEADACVPGALDAAYVEPSVTATVEPVTAPEDVLVGPMDADSYHLLFVEATETPATIQVEGEADVAPLIDEFSGNAYMTYWTLTGHVTDDGDPIRCRIYFGGALKGHFVDTMPDGSFFYYAYMPEGMSGLVSAIAIDSSGNQSPVASLVI